jgi:bacillopeptidase F (M6 metalloprotease family)
MKTPYFYIIKHKNTGRKYVGSKWAKDADTSTFMTESGYQTSSTTVWKLIEKDGLDSFEIEDIEGNESYISLEQFKSQGDLKKNTTHFQFCSSMSPEGKRRKLLRG